jgi:lipopolysaccharide export system permease protein
MDKLQKYILNQFFNIFLNIFFILFLITSIIIIISISNVTSSIHITFLEMLKMYFLSLTKIFIVTLSISFFIASIQTYANLSETQELVAIFSVGIRPKSILFPIFLVALIVTFMNFFTLFISIPYSDLAYHNFKNLKKQEAKFNIQTSKISQKLGDWYIFIEHRKKNLYNKVYLYNPKENKFITSLYADLIKTKNYLTFQLNDGYSYKINKNFLSVKFSRMNINHKISFYSFNILKYEEYFKKNQKLFLFYLPFALIPLGLFFYVPVFGFFHPRLHKNKGLIYGITILVVYLIICKIFKSFEKELITIFLFFTTGVILYLKDRKF